MNKKLTAFTALLKASMRMYFRNKGAVFFTLIFPLALLSVFGFLSKGGGSSLKLDITNYSRTTLSQDFVESLKKVPAFKVKEASEGEAAGELGKGNIDLAVIVPENFGARDSSNALLPAQIITTYNEAKPQNAQTANLVLGQIISTLNAKATGVPQILTVESKGVKTNNLGYFDFILPGLLAMTIMQAGIFGVAFAFVSLKASGALRRLHATPTHPITFVLAQAATRLVVTVLTIAILMGFGIAFFSFHMLGSYVEFSIIVLLGILVFLGFGFIIAGYAKDENQVAPLANIVQLPMLFLSGIFFARDMFPTWLYQVTNFFPLTYITDGMRHIANEGLHLTQIGGDVIGLLVWVVIVYASAVKVFRWD